MARDIKQLLTKLQPKKKAAKEPGVSVPAPRGVAFKSSKGPKFVLFIGDEGAILTYIIGKEVQSRQYVPDASDPSLGELQQTLSKNPDAPLYLVVDNMDQTYLQQTLPPVSSLSVGKLVKRRLERDFSETDIKGAIPLGREKKGRKDWNFMMVALERTEQLNIWVEFVEGLPNHFKGIYLVAVESEHLVQYIENALGPKKDDAPAEWKFMVSHNKVGGFRQVILRNNKVVFTRLAQPIGESSTEMVAGNIEQEMLSTIEYMKRLSYNPNDGLDIYIIASSGIKEVLDSNKFAHANTYVFTPYELADYLGIEGATQPTDQFGDVILAAAIGCSKKHTLTLTTPIAQQVNQFYQLILMQRMGAALGAIGIVVYTLTVLVGIISLAQDASDMEEGIQKQQGRLASLRDEIKRSDLDIEKANDLLVLYQQLESEATSPLPLIKTLYPMKKAPVWIKNISWRLGDKDNTNMGAFPTGDAARRMYTVLDLEFLNVAANPKGFKLVSNKVLADLKELMPGYEIDYLSIPAVYLEGDQMKITFDGNAVEEPQPQARAAPAPDVGLYITGSLLQEQLYPKKKTPPPATDSPPAEPAP